MQFIAKRAAVLALCAGLAACVNNGAPPPKLDADPVFAPVSQGSTQFVPVITYKNPAHGSVIRDKLRAMPDLAACKGELAKAAARPLTGGLAGAVLSEKACFELKPGAAQRKLVVG